MKGKSPFVEVISGSAILLTTPSEEQVDDEAMWSTDLSIETSPAALYEIPLKIRVKDKNGVNNDRVLGRAHIDSEKAVARFGKWVDITGDLLDDEGNPAGVYHLKGRYTRNNEKPTEEIAEPTPREEFRKSPLSSEPGVLEIQEVALKKLPNPGITTRTYTWRCFIFPHLSLSLSLLLPFLSSPLLSK
jgi:hypothetical protein